MQSLKALAIGAALFTMVAATGSANAQQSGTSQDQGCPWGGGSMGHGMLGTNGMMDGSGQDASRCAMMTGHIESRLAYLKTELQITDAQASLWNAYADAARASAQTMASTCDAMMDRTGSTDLSLLERLDRHEQFMAAQLDALRATSKALKPLYAIFSDSQKQTADQLFSSPMCMM